MKDLLKTIGDFLLAVAAKLNAITATIVLIVFFTTVYFIVDRYFDYKEAANPNNAEWLQEWKKNKVENVTETAGGTQE